MPAAFDASADLAGLYACPCDPLLLALNLDGRPLAGLAGEVDWRTGGFLSDLVVADRVPREGPLLLPAPEVLPQRQLVLWRAGAATAADLARVAEGLSASAPGLCARDFRLEVAEIRAAFPGRVVVYGG